MTELFTMLVLAANIIVASAFAKFAPPVAADVATAHEKISDADTYEGRVVARIRARDVRSAVARDIGTSTSAYWGSPLF
jgi:methenyltetrahydromethanopterin cyclohydrolase